MNENIKEIIDLLEKEHSLSEQQYESLILAETEQTAEYIAQKARRIRSEIYGNSVYIRGLIEIGNICTNDCLYCGIRKSNKNCERYLLTKEQILQCCDEGYPLGFRTFVMQGGEGALPVKKICDTVYSIKSKYPDCAVTLSLGEYTGEEYRQMYLSGADRYLLRHETADKAHYQALHPSEMSFENRMRCLYDLKSIGFQVGCGFMVGSPYQSARNLAKDLKFIETFSPDMCGIGPFIPQRDTPFAAMPAGSAEQTVYLLSILRLIKPNLLLPATTALGSVQKGGREMGVLAGANVIMPNLSPLSERKKYSLYDNKLYTGEESAQSLELLKRSMAAIGCKIDCSRGDIIK